MLRRTHVKKSVDEYTCVTAARLPRFYYEQSNNRRIKEVKKSRFHYNENLEHQFLPTTSTGWGNKRNAKMPSTTALILIVKTEVSEKYR